MTPIAPDTLKPNDKILSTDATGLHDVLRRVHTIGGIAKWTLSLQGIITIESIDAWQAMIGALQNNYVSITCLTLRQMKVATPRDRCAQLLRCFLEALVTNRTIQHLQLLDEQYEQCYQQRCMTKNSIALSSCMKPSVWTSFVRMAQVRQAPLGVDLRCMQSYRIGVPLKAMSCLHASLIKLSHLPLDWNVIPPTAHLSSVRTQPSHCELWNVTIDTGSQFLHYAGPVPHGSDYRKQQRQRMRRLAQWLCQHSMIELYINGPNSKLLVHSLLACAAQTDMRWDRLRKCNVESFYVLRPLLPKIAPHLRILDSQMVENDLADLALPSCPWTQLGHITLPLEYSPTILHQLLANHHASLRSAVLDSSRFLYDHESTTMPLIWQACSNLTSIAVVNVTPLDKYLHSMESILLNILRMPTCRVQHLCVDFRIVRNLRAWKDVLRKMKHPLVSFTLGNSWGSDDKYDKTVHNLHLMLITSHMPQLLSLSPCIRPHPTSSLQHLYETARHTLTNVVLQRNAWQTVCVVLAWFRVLEGHPFQDAVCGVMEELCHFTGGARCPAWTEEDNYRDPSRLHDCPAPHWTWTSEHDDRECWKSHPRRPATDYHALHGLLR